ncbi:MAG TPA: RDD family protein [Mucilaginibacter sp.]
MQPSNNVYILVVNGKPEGPFNLDELKGLGIKQDDFIKTPEMVDYKEAHELPELRQIFHFSKQSVIPQYFAGFDQRWMASALDWFFIAGFYLVIAAVAVLMITDKGIRLGIAFSLLVLIPLTKIIYHMVMECSVKQATHGKQILKIKVCDLEGNRISPGRSIARNLCKIFSLLTIVGYLLGFFNKKQQCLHDMICDTLVMKDRLF